MRRQEGDRISISPRRGFTLIRLIPSVLFVFGLCLHAPTAQACCRELYKHSDPIRYDLCQFRYNNCVDLFRSTKRWHGMQYLPIQRHEQCCLQVREEINDVINRCLESKKACGNPDLYDRIKKSALASPPTPTPNPDGEGESEEDGDRE